MSDQHRESGISRLSRRNQRDGEDATGWRRPQTYEVGSSPEALLDDPDSDTILNKGPDLPKDLASEKDDRGRAVADLGVLGTSDVDERLRGRVDNVEELKDGGAVVRDGGVTLDEGREGVGGRKEKGVSES